ncbi:MAG TPA: FHA domain-containing protein [Gemmataceae bacterium]|jgi:pSer/pThr/pTyr-binding forkhead associated (FHA) protein
MDTTLTLQAVAGSLAGGTYYVPAAGSCVIGRAEDCDVSLPNTWDARTASRHHCRVAVTPAGAAVRDLGSRNGTFLNGKSIGRRPADAAAADRPADGTYFPLADGDELRVGDTVLRVVLAAAAAGQLARIDARE